MPVLASSAAIKPPVTATPKARGQAHTKKTRVVRRRGRAKGDFDSDEEIEREIATDSDTDDDLSSLDSASDSDTEPASEDVITTDRSDVLTSTAPPGFEATAKRALTDVSGANGAFFTNSGNWSEMVADETTHGPADLPVIDFADFSGHAVPPPKATRQRKLHKSKQPAAQPEPQSPQKSSVEPPAQPVEDEPTPSSSSQPVTASVSRRAPGQTARQAYQKRLEDPSFVPKVGEFWGHDDRLLDKDLRSLSGWWRGRWQGRGRGRGSFDRGFGPRGRGGHHPGSRPQSVGQDGSENTEPQPLQPVREIEVPPIDRAWTHDGYEEMKRKDEQRHSHHKPGGLGNSRGGRGGFVANRGRGGFASSSSSRYRTAPNFTPPPGRPWFAMKPERVWTKQHEGFLYFDPALKPRNNQGPGIRVKLPGSHGLVIRTPLQRTVALPVEPIVNDPHPSVVSDYDDKHVVVRLPSRRKPEKRKEVSVPESKINSSHSSNTSSVPQMPSASTSRSPQVVEAATQNPTTAPVPSEPPHDLSEAIPDSASPMDDAISASQAELQHAPEDTEQRPSLHPLQTTFTPPMTSPTYGSPYAYAPALPPGLALNQHGVPYELSTGRPVYFQPPMPPMYDPRSVLHPSMPPFVPGHMHHPSMDSPDLLANAQPMTHAPAINNFVDPSTGAPIFSFPRQTRIEIRAPTDQDDEKPTSGKTTRKASGLRTTATTFEPARLSHNLNPQVPEYESGTNYGAEYIVPGGDDSLQSPPMDPNMMGFSPYSQQYYYPNYVYPQYMDMSQIPQYEFYPPDPRLQGTVYY